MATRTAFLVFAFVLAGGACGSRVSQEEVDRQVADAIADATANMYTQEQVDALLDAATTTTTAPAPVDPAVEAAEAISAAVEACSGLSTSRYVQVDEGGLVLEGAGEESAGLQIANLKCPLTRLGMPDSVWERMLNTNSTMGLVDGAWGMFEASWSYHPDNGLFVHVEVAS